MHVKGTLNVDTHTHTHTHKHTIRKNNKKWICAKVTDKQCHREKLY